MMPKIIIPPIALHPGQQRILESEARFRVISAGRRFGKTMLAVEWLALAEGGAIEGAPVAFFSPTYKLLLDVWSDMERTLKPVIRKASKTEMRIELITGGKIDFWTLEDPNAGRGRKYKRIVLDESAHARYLQEAWERAISPTLTDYRGEAWFISTPNGLNYFHTLFRRGESEPGWQSFQMPTVTNPFIPHDEIESARQQLPELVFRQEYLAEFVTFGAGLVKPEQIQESVTPKGMATYMGVDLAISTKSGADYTAIAVVSKCPDTGTVYVLDMVRFRSSFNDMIKSIKSMADKWKPAMINIEQVQYQAAVVQELIRSTDLPVRGVRPDKDKVTRFLPLLTRYEQGKVIHDSSLPLYFTDELLSFPQGEHDDCVDALVYAFRASSSTEFLMA